MSLVTADRNKLSSFSKTTRLVYKLSTLLRDMICYLLASYLAARDRVVRTLTAVHRFRLPLLTLE